MAKSAATVSAKTVANYINKTSDTNRQKICGLLEIETMNALKGFFDKSVKEKRRIKLLELEKEEKRIQTLILNLKTEDK
ncbi:MAG: hypothetical protein HRT89_01445 [Lentisphaeria bacterium]|nr:hypothetical protein [Lentisphaeria bacterium]NQZ66710.1 hypothetical protein [Lentisphaeria bacterium]